MCFYDLMFAGSEEMLESIPIYVFCYRDLLDWKSALFQIIVEQQLALITIPTTVIHRLQFAMDLRGFWFCTPR